LLRGLDITFKQWSPPPSEEEATESPLMEEKRTTEKNPFVPSKKEERPQFCGSFQEI